MPVALIFAIVTALFAMVVEVPPAAFVTSPVKALVWMPPLPVNSRPPPTVSCSTLPVSSESRPRRRSVAMFCILANVTALAATVAGTVPVPEPVTSPVSVTMPTPFDPLPMRKLTNSMLFVPATGAWLNVSVVPAMVYVFRCWYTPPMNTCALLPTPPGSEASVKIVCEPVPLNTCRVIDVGAALELAACTVGLPLASKARNVLARTEADGNSMSGLASEIGALMDRATSSAICWIWMVARSNESVMTSG